MNSYDRPVKPGIVVGTSVLKVPVAAEVKAALDNWHEARVNQLAEVLAPFGLHPFDLAEVQYMRVVTAADVRGQVDEVGTKQLAGAWNDGFDDGFESSSYGWAGTSESGDEFGGNFPRRNPFNGEERRS